MNNFFIILGIIFLLLGSFLIYFGFHNNERRFTPTLGLLIICIGIIFILVPYREYKDFYENNTVPIDNTFYYIGAEIIDQSIAGTTIFETEDGNLYEIETNPNWDWDCIYLLTMDDNATPYNKTDDSICVVWVENN